MSSNKHQSIQVLALVVSKFDSEKLYLVFKSKKGGWDWPINFTLRELPEEEECKTILYRYIYERLALGRTDVISINKELTLEDNKLIFEVEIDMDKGITAPNNSHYSWRRREEVSLIKYS
jgi:hypothetical protein